MNVFTPKGLAQITNALPELKRAEMMLRGFATQRGIVYELPDYAGLRTQSDTTQLIRWRDEAVTKARKDAEAKRKTQGGTPVQVKLAGDVAANRAFYRVSPYGVGYHGIGGAFDVRITKVPAGMTVEDGYKYLGGFASTCGLTWGGVFKDNPSTSIKESADPFHFELSLPRVQVENMFRNFALNAAKPKTGTASKTGLIAAIVIGLVFVGVAIAGHR